MAVVEDFPISHQDSIIVSRRRLSSGGLGKDAPPPDLAPFLATPPGESSPADRTDQLRFDSDGVAVLSASSGGNKNTGSHPLKRISTVSFKRTVIILDQLSSSDTDEDNDDDDDFASLPTPFAEQLPTTTSAQLHTTDSTIILPLSHSSSLATWGSAVRRSLRVVSVSGAMDACQADAAASPSPGGQLLAPPVHSRKRAAAELCRRAGGWARAVRGAAASRLCLGVRR